MKSTIIAVSVGVLLLSIEMCVHSRQAVARYIAPVPADFHRKPTAATKFDAIRKRIGSPEPNTIVGRAVDEQGQPIHGAEALLFRANEKSWSRELSAKATSGADGRFRFDDVVNIVQEFPGGTYPPEMVAIEEAIMLAVRAPRRVTVTMVFAPLDVAQTGGVAPAILTPGVTLRGRVTGPEGKPLERAMVSMGDSSILKWEGVRSAFTDRDGNYVIDDTSSFDMKNFLAYQEEQRRMLVAQSNRKDSTISMYFTPPLLTVELPGFATKKIDFEKVPGTRDVQLDPAAIIEGRVIYGDSGKPAADVIVLAATPERNDGVHGLELALSQHQAAVRTDAEGKYHFNTLPAGSYEVFADSAGWINAGVSLHATTEKTNSVPDLTLTKFGLLRFRLIDDKTREPIEVPPNTYALLNVMHRGKPQRLRFFPQWMAVSSDGKFEYPAVSDRTSVTVSSVVHGKQTLWVRSSPPGKSSLPVDAADGAALEIDVPVVTPEAKAKADADALADEQELATQLNRAKRLLLSGRLQETIELSTSLLEKDPNLIIARMVQAEARGRLGQFREAIHDYEQLLQQDLNQPLSRIVRNNLAYQLATSPDESLRDGQRAVVLAEEALKLSDRPVPDIYDTLAAAYAETGDFDQAIETQQKAIELAPKNELYREHLDLYQSKQPLRASNE